MNNKKYNLSVAKFRAVTGIVVTNKHTGKMTDLKSISTSPAKAKFCLNRAQNNDSICSHCFAFSMIHQYNNLGVSLAKNHEVLTTHLLSDNEVLDTTTKSGFFRFQAFGDTDNWIELANYCKIAKANKQTLHAIWTKNYKLFRSYFSENEKPNNLKIVYSSPLFNVQMKIDPIKDYFVNHVFTVYTKKYILDHPEIKINCGAKSCAKCGLCYKKRTKAFFINELLKSDNKNKEY